LSELSGVWKEEGDLFSSERIGMMMVFEKEVSMGIGTRVFVES
jgi:hypothetical protein